MFVMNTNRKMTPDEEYEYVKNVFIPFLERCKQEKLTLLDLGHHNLYFINGLVQYLTDTSYKFIFVRIRRNRIESAISLSYKNPGEQYNDLCHNIRCKDCSRYAVKGLITRYCPYDRVEDVVLHPPSKAVWENFTVTQQAVGTSLCIECL